MAIEVHVCVIALTAISLLRLGIVLSGSTYRYSN